MYTPSFLQKGLSAYVGLSMILASTLAAVTVPFPSVAATMRLASAQTEQPILPKVDASMKARLQALLDQGRAHGNRANVFAKIGDSITESGSFLIDNGCISTEVGNYTTLQSVIDYFRLPQPGQADFPSSYSSAWCSTDPHGSNSFTRSSVAATSGWTTDDALSGTPNAVARELTAMHPGFAVIMLGTNDVDRSADPTGFETRLGQIVDQVIAQGVVPVVSTIPARRDSSVMNERVMAFNEAIARIARTRQIPLLNYWLAMNSLPNQGISDDGIHPSIYPGPRGDGADAGFFTDAALQYGYNLRNLTTVQALEKMKRIVIDDGIADSGSSPVPSAAPLANLVGSWNGLTQTCRTVGGNRETCTWRGQYVERNMGTKTAAAHRVALYASKDGRLDAGDRLVKQYVVGGLAAGARRTSTVSVTLPVGVHPTHAIGFIDVNRQIIESNENDNGSVIRLP